MKGDEEHKGNWSTTSDYIFINDWNGNSLIILFALQTSRKSNSRYQ